MDYRGENIALPNLSFLCDSLEATANLSCLVVFIYNYNLGCYKLINNNKLQAGSRLYFQSLAKLVFLVAVLAEELLVSGPVVIAVGGELVL